MLHIQNLVFGYANKAIIDRFSYTAHPGDIVLIVGANGVGKSTLMSLIAGLRTPNSGEIFWGDPAKIKNQSHNLRGICDYLPAEANGHFLKLDTETNLHFWHRLNHKTKADPALLDQVLKRWHLDHPLVRKSLAVEKFSTGMKRRLAMARLELNATPLWLLDEPLFGLDQQGIKTFIDVLKQHQSHAGISLIITHDSQPFISLNPKTLDANSFLKNGLQ